MVKNEVTDFIFDYKLLRKKIEVPWYRFILPCLFGKRVVTEDDGCTVTGWHYKGNVYIWSITHHDT